MPDQPSGTCQVEQKIKRPFKTGQGQMRHGFLCLTCQKNGTSLTHCCQKTAGVHAMDRACRRTQKARADCDESNPPTRRR